MIRNGLPYNIAQTHSRKFIESSTTKTAKAFNLGQTISKNSGLCKFLYQSIYGRKGDETADPKLFPTASSNHRSTKRSRDRRPLGVAYSHDDGSTGLWLSSKKLADLRVPSSPFALPARELRCSEAVCSDVYQRGPLQVATRAVCWLPQGAYPSRAPTTKGCSDCSEYRPERHIRVMTASTASTEDVEDVDRGLR